MRPYRSHAAIASIFLGGMLFIPAGIAAQDAASIPRSEEDELYFLLFGEEPPLESPDDLLLVAQVSVECPPSLDEAFVLSFAPGISVGDEIRARELDELLEGAQERMSFSGMFYTSSAACERLEAEAGEDGLVSSRIVIRASEGFWWGFGFSPWDLSIAYRNLGGAGKEIGATIGLNSQALSYRDPSIAHGPLHLAAEAGHRVSQRGSRVDPSYLYEELALSGELGIKVGDELKLGLALGYRAFRSPEEYFLYSEYEPPTASALGGLGLSSGASSLLSAGARVELGSYSFQKRGGMRATTGIGIDGLASSAGGWEIVPRYNALGLLRIDAPALLRLTLRERILYVPRTAAAGIPQPLWASVGELRCASGLVTGEFASVSRISLELDRVAAIGLGFAELGIVPELFYEFGAVKRASYDEKARFQQDIGFLVKLAASMPIGKTFAFGAALGLAGESDSRAIFVFEVR